MTRLQNIKHSGKEKKKNKKTPPKDQNITNNNNKHHIFKKLMFDKNGEVDRTFFKNGKKKFDCIKILNNSDIVNYRKWRLISISGTDL